MRSKDKFSFYKYDSAGNDFILIEDEPFSPTQGWSRLCHRRFGIGADGVLFFCESKRADFKMVYFNADGAKVAMCGNGARAVAAHYFSKHPQKMETKFEVGSEIYRSTQEGGRYSVEMNEYRDHGLISIDELSLPDFIIRRDYLDTGVPHLVLECNQAIDAVNLTQLAHPLRHDKRFLEGVNVNIFYMDSSQKVHMRTFERGVEDETFACGTGAIAVARSVWRDRAGMSDKIDIQVLGGKLLARRTGERVELIGPSTCVYLGKID